MGRTLPWKKGDSTLTPMKSSGNPRSTGSASRPPKSSPPSSSAATPIRSASRPRPAAPTSHPRAEQLPPSRARILDRSPSSSPPPQPIPESFMIEGFDHDDQWRMVEDEFYAVAGQFTAHLHVAQYRRLREEAKKQNVNAIPRPVTAPPTSRVKRRQAALTLATAQRQGVKTAMSRINGEDTGDEDDEIPWRGTRLAGLMTSPRRKVQPLAYMTSAAGGSRARALSSHENPFSTRTTTDHCALGYVAPRTAPQPHTTSQRAQGLGESDDDDDLERYSSRQSPTYQGLSRPKPGAAKTQTSQWGQSRSALYPGGVAPTSKETPIVKPSHVSGSSSAAVAPVLTDHDSDSGPETYFQRRMKERRRQHKSARYKLSTPDGPSEKDEGKPGQQKSQESQSAVLAVPSF